MNSTAAETAGGIGERISIVAEVVGGKKTLADMAGISESQLHRYIAGASQPTLAPLIAIADAGGVSFDWLARGRGSAMPMPSEPGSEIPLSEVDCEVLHSFFRFRRKSNQHTDIRADIENFVAAYNGDAPSIRRIPNVDRLVTEDVLTLVHGDGAASRHASLAADFFHQLKASGTFASTSLLAKLFEAVERVPSLKASDELSGVLYRAHSVVFAAAPSEEALEQVSVDDLTHLLRLVARLYDVPVEEK